ncbi:hypothetical protein FEM48_Zijuj11G0022800 [Ziziphus jujuba var. spinosa]|uniref:DUF7722 domain-containing protein n=1 Tax=Ziziphus jujuba var. spinosa TaxID=714518 RepID=A0A978UG90_ZIZJJ|nr:hypothetical protein FEM48_Zijuj11G0022800 [Ziziphus jujuba var. spinosa]
MPLDKLEETKNDHSKRLRFQEINVPHLVLFPASYSTLQELRPNGHHHHQQVRKNEICQFQMPLHYPRYKKKDYETMPEWRLDCLFTEYGLPISGDVNQKRKFAMGAFLWPNSSQED